MNKTKLLFLIFAMSSIAILAAEDPNGNVALSGQQLRFEHGRGDVVIEPAFLGNGAVQVKGAALVRVPHPIPKPAGSMGWVICPRRSIHITLSSVSVCISVVLAKAPASASFVMEPFTRYRSPPSSAGIRSRFSSSRMSLALIQPFCRATA